MILQWTCEPGEYQILRYSSGFILLIACLPFAIPVYFFYLFFTLSESHPNKAQDLICSREFLSKGYCHHSAYLWFPSNVKDLCFFFVSASRWLLILNWGILKSLKTLKPIIENLTKETILKSSVASTNTAIYIIPTWFHTSESLIVIVESANCESSLVYQKNQVNDNSSLDVILSEAS